ncbi:pimeloyl-ACP methyl ester carboxylesterase [Spinactinospora alkalitolerans]|uniref:Pimeloyl-ACP methyl ester carboxylesterase n=1 Tax=Spinactinospora alkalitolerans TaxID=687207 RepID=A0A852TVZ2_9ACTN|nr:alpha/beta hydrolase [Spinactinospora alkalitolerans]NYE47477.1 pimeloyl-ACP methyl ester carboxylesterase [Spinactinospora alkalitolerans]
MHTVTSNDGTTIAYDRFGDGPPVVYVGGAFCDRSTGAPLAELLAPRFTVYSYDRRGRGASGDTAPYTVRREVEDLEAVIAAAGGSASVFGISSGAALALEAAAQGAAVTRLAIYEAPFTPDGDHAQLRQAKEDGARLTELLSAGRRADAVEFFMTGAGVSAEDIAQMRGAPMWSALEQMAPTLAYDYAVMGISSSGGAIPTERVAGIAVPTLVLDGGAGLAWMQEAAETVAKTLPHGRYRRLEGQTHEVDPEVLAPVLEEFFAAAAEGTR